MTKIEFPKDTRLQALMIICMIALAGVIGFSGSQFTNQQMRGVEERLANIEGWLLDNTNWTTGASLNPRYHYSYLIFDVAGTYYARNGSTSAIDFTNSSLLNICQATNDVLTNGGLIVIKDMEKPAGLNIASNVVFEVYYQNEIKYYTSSSSGKVGNSPICVNDTFVLQNNTNEQTLLELTPNTITCYYNFLFDMDSLTKNVTIKVYSKIDGDFYVELPSLRLENIPQSAVTGLVLSELWANTDLKFTIQSVELEGATRNIYYRYFKEEY